MPDAGPAADGADKPLLLVAACALIDADGRVLLARRPEGKKMAGLWEFPGGKLDPGETPEAALIRELHEELGIEVAGHCLAPFAFASHAYADIPSADAALSLPPLARHAAGPGGADIRLGAAGQARRVPHAAADRPLVPLLRDFL